MRRIVLYFVMLSAVAIYGQDVLPASYSPPGGLAVDKVPMFVCFGWDDNNYADGMNWIIDYIKDKKNPAGSGNTLTFDGKKLRNTFFMKGMVESSETVEAVLASWKRAYDEGHEIGNHTFQHVAVDPVNEIRKCDSVLQQIGIPKNVVVGFRTPQLAIVPSVFDAVHKRPFLFDCTFEHHNGGSTNGSFVWPYTMEKGIHSSAYGAISTSYPGMWEMPVYQFTDGTTGFDYNAWTGGLSGSAYCSKLKSNLDHRLSTNRCPMLIGVHSDYYASTNTDFDKLVSAKLAARRQAIADFITYALTKPDVRIVAYVDAINWMRKPVGLGQTKVSAAQNHGVSGEQRISVTNSGLIKISVPFHGIYAVSIYTQSGKRILHAPGKYYTAGDYTNALPLQICAGGLYVITVRGYDGFRQNALFFRK